MFPKTEIVVTEDGSPSLFVPELKEQYHSRFGAITESMHIYIGLGLHAIRSQNVSIFEVGFGTGLNAFLTLTESVTAGKTIMYDSIEFYPISKEIAGKLDYPSLVKGSDPILYTKLHETEWEKEISILPGFTLRKLKADFSSYIFDRKYDLVYFDAFAPLVQPEMWTQERFDRISGALNPGGIFVTYSAMGEIRRRLIASGLVVKRLPGPPGKREILQAFKP